MTWLTCKAILGGCGKENSFNIPAHRIYLSLNKIYYNHNECKRRDEVNTILFSKIPVKHFRVHTTKQAPTMFVLMEIIRKSLTQIYASYRNDPTFSDR